MVRVALCGVAELMSRSRENYLLHMPVKMSLAALVSLFKLFKAHIQLFKKILRVTDVKTIEAHNLTDKQTEEGKGRSQIINLLTIDSGSMAGLSCHLWNASNALIARKCGVAHSPR